MRGPVAAVRALSNHNHNVCAASARAMPSRNEIQIQIQARNVRVTQVKPTHEHKWALAQPCALLSPLAALALVCSFACWFCFHFTSTSGFCFHGAGALCTHASQQQHSMELFCCCERARAFRRKIHNTNTKYICKTGPTRNKLLEQWVHRNNERCRHGHGGRGGRHGQITSNQLYM